MAKKIYASYDEMADVAYISIGEPDRSARNIEAEMGVVWRVTPDGTYKGATLLNFRRHWRGKSKELVALLKSNLRVNSAAEKKILGFA